MYFIDIVKRSLRSLLSAKTRTLLTALAIAVGTFALSLTLAARNGAQNYGNTIIKNNFDPTELIVTKDGGLFNSTDASKPQVYNQSFGTVTSGTGVTSQVQMLGDSDLTRLSHLSGVTSATPAISLNLQYLTRDGERKYVATMQTYNAYQKPDLLAGSIPTKLASNTVVLPQGFLSALGFSSAHDAIGKVVRIAVAKQALQATSASAIVTQIEAGTAGKITAQADNPSEHSVTVVAVYKTPSSLIQAQTGLYLYGSRQEVESLNDYATAGTASYHKYLSADVRVTDGTNTSKLNSVQAAIEKIGYSAQSVLDTEKTLTQVINVLQGIVIVFGLIAVVASVFGVVNTMYISVLQRTREIGLMKALGMHKKDVTKLFRYEAAIIGFLGGVLGSGLAVVVGTLANPLISKKLGLGTTNLLDFKILQVVILIVILVLVTIVAGLLPARKAARLDPIEALRTE